MSKNITRIQKDKDFSITNNTWLSDTRLGWKAKGLLAYILSLSDNEKICVKELATHSIDGINSTTSAMKDLMENRYITRELFKNEKGQLEGYSYTIHTVSQLVEDGINKTIY